MKKTIKVQSIQPKTKSDGTALEGMTKKGGLWKIWAINDKYSYFAFANIQEDLDIKPDFEGKTIEFDLEEKTSQVGDKEFTNYTLSNPEEVDDVPSGDLEERFNKMAEYLEEKFSEILTAIEDIKR
jgi:hypothetical protein